MEPTTSLVGVKLATLVPAVGGGIVAGFIMSGPWHWRIAAGVSGVFSSIFLTDLAMVTIGYLTASAAPELAASAAFIAASERAAAFVLGLTGMVFCQTLLATVERVRRHAPGVVDRRLKP